MRFAVLASLALAQAGIPLGVTVGETVEADVGDAIGWFCDDPALIHATMASRPHGNVWIVTGVTPGTTLCRIGTDYARSSYLFAVTVYQARP